MNRAVCMVLGCLLSVPPLITTAQSLDFSFLLLPAAPVAQDQVVARVTVPSNCLDRPGAVTVSQSNEVPAKLIVRVPPNTDPSCLPFATPSTFDIELGRFPVGTYTVDLVYAQVTVGTKPFTVDANPAKSVVPFPTVDYTDHWWNSSEPGWGISIHQHTSGRLFAVWFAHDTQRNPTWYTLQPGSWTAFNIFSGPVYRTTGPYFAAPYSNAQVERAVVGQATLSFHNAFEATFTYDVAGVSGSKGITRLPF